MKLSDMLVPDRIAVPMEARDLDGALEAVCAALREAEALRREASSRLARDLASGQVGAVMRGGTQTVIAVTRTDAVDDVVMGVGVAREAFTVDLEDPEVAGSARALFLVLTPRRMSSLVDGFLPAILKWLEGEDNVARLLASDGPDDIRRIGGLMEIEVKERLLVEDALTPLQYRIYPDTPLQEAVELMVRRELHAVPVVGEDLGVLGIISVGDALGHLLARRGQHESTPREGKEESGPVTAREVMTRTVLCVAEDESLLDAGKLMVNRDVEQLPVVREGQLIGFITRSAILKRIVGSPSEGD